MRFRSFQLLESRVTASAMMPALACGRESSAPVVQIVSLGCGVVMARLLGDARRSVEYWVGGSERDGLAGLLEEGRPGRPRRLNSKQLEAHRSSLAVPTAGSRPEREYLGWKNARYFDFAEV